VRVATDRLAVAPDVAVLAARDHHNRLGIAGVAHPSMGMCVDTGYSSGAEPVCGPVSEPELDLALMDEVRLLLLLVVVDPCLVSRGQDDRVDPKRRNAYFATDLPEPVSIAHLVERRDGISLALISHFGQS
jgi:hypothetical protein